MSDPQKKTIEEILNAVYSGTELAGVASAEEILNVVFNEAEGALNLSSTGSALPASSADGTFLVGDGAGEWEDGGGDLTYDGAVLTVPSGTSGAALGLQFGDGGGMWRSGTNLFMTPNTNSWLFQDSIFRASNANRAGVSASRTNLTLPVFLPDYIDPDTGLGSDGEDILSLIVGGKSGLQVDGSGASVVSYSLGDLYFGETLDSDVAPSDFSVNAQSAYPSATTNVDGAGLIFNGGDATPGSNGNGGDITLAPGTEAGTGTPGYIVLSNLPTSDPAVAGALWNDSGTLKVSAG